MAKDLQSAFSTRLCASVIEMHFDVKQKLQQTSGLLKCKLSIFLGYATVIWFCRVIIFIFLKAQTSDEGKLQTDRTPLNYKSTIHAFIY